MIVNFFQNAIDRVKPILRMIKYNSLKYSAQRKAHSKSKNFLRKNYPLIFIIGCGRSGTTILGQILANHPQVQYIFEPYHLWAAIDPRTDAINLFHQIDACLLMDSSHIETNTQNYFNCLFNNFRLRKSVKLIIEKTPLNILRIGYLEALAPNSKYIHLVRDGVDVCYSIEKLATTNSYKITGKPKLNQWWGVNNSKWKTLQKDGVRAGYYPDEIIHLNSDRIKAAYEWLVSLGEIQIWRSRLGDRVREITYTKLTQEPDKTLTDLAIFLEIDLLPSWLNDSVAAIENSYQTENKTISLPPKMCRDFNQYQQQYGFKQRANYFNNN